MKQPILQVKNVLNQKTFEGVEEKWQYLLTKNNIKSRLQYATKNLDRPVELWKNVLWIDVTNWNFSDPSAVCLVQKIKTYEWKNTILKIKHGDRPVFIWGCFAVAEVEILTV